MSTVKAFLVSDIITKRISFKALVSNRYTKKTFADNTAIRHRAAE